MSGSSTSHNSATLIGCRVAGAPTYTPAYMPNGGQKPVRQMATMTVYQNINGKPSKFRVTAWGKMADVVARSCAPGKEITLMCEIHSYQGKIPVPNQAQGAPLNFILGPDNQPIMVEKTGFVVRRIHFGQDSDKQIQFEIQNGMRPQMWNVAGHPDNVAWKNTCQQRNATQFAPGMNQFGYAIVRTPNGQLVDPATINNANFNSQAGGQPAGGGWGGNGTGTGQYQQNGGGNQGGQQPAGFQGVNQNGQYEVHGQEMGYPAGQQGGGQAAGAQGGTGFVM